MKYTDVTDLKIGDLVLFKGDDPSFVWTVEGFTKHGYVTVWRWDTTTGLTCSQKKIWKNYLPYDLIPYCLNEKPDKVQHPPHYTKWPIQPRDFCMKNNLPFWMGSVLKYIMRAGQKQYDGLTIQESEILDLEKAREFIEHRIRMIKNG